MTKTNELDKRGRNERRTNEEEKRRTRRKASTVEETSDARRPASGSHIGATPCTVVADDRKSRRVFMSV